MRLSLLPLVASWVILAASRPSFDRGASLAHVEASRMLMACLYAIDAYAGTDEQTLRRTLEAALDEVDRIDRLMSHYKPDSPLSRINREAGRHPVPVDPELFGFIKRSLRYSEESDGAFDITVGPLMKAWGFFGGEGHLPSASELTAARQRLGASHVILNENDLTIRFDTEGVQLDLGGIAKGYAVDRVVAILRARHVDAALVSAGGSTIYGLGAPPGTDGWRVEIQDPRDARKVAREVTLRNRSLSVAGSSEKSFEANGIRYSHIMDPRTGRPVQGLLSVATLTDTGTDGDALDDALFVLGPSKSAAYLKRYPNTEAFFFVPDAGGGWTLVNSQRPTVDLEALPFAPRHYIAFHAPSPITIDGKLDDPSWNVAPWTETFVDIEGDRRPQPRFRTRTKMLWDDNWFYIAAEMEEPDVWGTLTERDSVIFRDNDFEVFIDPDGDTHAYYELEVNALGTPWDLMLIKPYRDGGPAVNGWDIDGLRARVDVKGSINRPGDRDEGWTIELALPWKILKEAAPGQRRPAAGDRWRVNFSRVEWQTDVRDGKYVKRTKPGSTEALPEDNWVWSPQGAINMHLPERWGYVQFSETRSGSGADTFVDDPNERVKWALRRLYYRQGRYRAANGMYATTLDALNVPDIRVEGIDFKPTLNTTSSTYEITAAGFDKTTLHITSDGRVWSTRNP
jgi:thiamine biosynthesis lipoprotein ApbE